MALKDLKSDLSKFRMPKKDPLENKKIDEVNKKSNQTPLSSMVDSAPKIPRSQTTTNKEGVEPRKFDNSSQFLGETTPNKVDNSPNFLGETTPNKTDNLEQFLGETTPNKFDNSEKFLGETTQTPSNRESKFLGETTPNSVNNTGQFLGETTQTPAQPQSQFLGETTPTKSNLEERFLGETDPNNFDNSENFLGETTPTPANNESRFLGETDPNNFDNSSNFLGETTPSSTNNTGQFLGETTPSSTDNTGQFLGETTPNPANNQSQFLGETDPTSKDSTGQFLGETTPSSTNNTGQFLGETTKDKITQGDKEKGETTPTEFTFNPNHSDRGVTPTDVNYFEDIHALGFNSKFGGVESSKFIGVSPDNTVFDGTTSLYSNIDNSTFTLGKTYEQSFDSAGRLNSGETGFGIGKSQGERKSPSFLDLQYAKFNLKDDSFNTGLGLFRHPLILRGIQRKGISKGEPQSWGVLGVTFDDGLIRGGAITSTVRAAIDAARIGAWMLSVEGLLWGVKQLGLQQSNPNVETVTGKRLTKVWTPVNTLASVLGQHIGLHPRRHGLLPLPEKVGPEKYEFVQKAKTLTHNTGDVALGLPVTGNRLVGLYNESFLTTPYGSMSTLSEGLPFLRLQGLGGPNSLYGIIPGGKVPTRDFNTIPDTIGNPREPINTIQNQYNPTLSEPSDNPTNISSVSTPFDRDSTKLGKDAQTSYNDRPVKVADGTPATKEPINTIQNQYNPVLNEPSTNPTNTSGVSTPFDRDSTELGKDAQTPYTDRKPEYTPTPDPNKESADNIGNGVAGSIYSNEYTYGENREDLEGNDLAIIRDVVLDDTNKRVNLNTTETHTTYDNPFNKQINTLDDLHDLNSNISSGEIIRRYETVAYGNLPNRIAGDITINDFRSLLSDGNPNKEIATSDDYIQYNINKRVNFGNPGKLGPNENRVEWWNTDKTQGGTGGKNDRYDKINALDVGESPDAATDGDLVNMWFKAEGGSKVQFRGTAKGITETFSPSWDSFKYNGRADQAYKYTTFERSVSFNFQVYATSRIEMKPIWTKLQYLSTMTMPQYGGAAGYQGTLVTFRLGSLYNGKLAFIESLSYTMSDETPWEISMLGSNEPIGELPMGIDVSIGLKILGDVLPQLGTTGIYSWGTEKNGKF